MHSLCARSRTPRVLFIGGLLATKNRRDRRGGFSHVRVLGFSHKEQERQERSRERRNKRGLGGVGLWLQTIFKKFVIVCHCAHTFTWLNLLLEPKRHLQRFGFVFLGSFRPLRRKKIKIFLSSLSSPCIQFIRKPNKIKGFMLFVGIIIPAKIFFVYPLARKPQDML